MENRPIRSQTKIDVLDHRLKIDGSYHGQIIDDSNHRRKIDQSDQRWKIDGSYHGQIRDGSNHRRKID